MTISGDIVLGQPAGDWRSGAQVVVVIPTYNEVDNLPPITAALLALSVPALHLLVIDDASPDGTGAAADRLAQRHPDRVSVIHRTHDRGLGRSYIEGFRAALALGAQYVVQMDADFSHNPADVPRLLDACADADVVIGSRYVSGGGLDQQWSWWRRFLSWWANTVWARLLLGTHIQDATAGFRCWRRATLQGIGLERVHSNGYIFQVEMTHMAEQLGYRIVELPIFFEDRRVGRSKMTMSVKLEATWRTALLRWRHRRLVREGRRG